MTEFCDQATSTYLSTTAQCIKPLDRSLVQIYALCGFSLSFFEIITQPFPWPVWRQPAATSSASKEQNPEQPWISACSGATLRDSAWGNPWGSCRQTPLGNALGCHRGGACPALGLLWTNIRNRIITDLMENHHQNQHHYNPNETSDWPTCALREVDFRWNQPKELASCTPLMILGNYFNPPAQSPDQTSYHGLWITSLEVFVKPAQTSSDAAHYSRHHSSKAQA